MSANKDPDWSKPHDVDPITVVFPANVVGTLLPPMRVIPDEFHEWNNPWCRLMSEWFYSGLQAPPKFKPGIDARAAMLHLKACLGSFEPKHEHKEAGVAYLLSLWCESPAIPKAARKAPAL